MSIPTHERIANGLISHPWILMFIILIFLGGAAFLAWVIRRGKRQVGRSSAHEQLESQSSHDQVSKRYLIVDLQSPTWVWLNGVRIAPSLPSPLLPGMMIALGHDTQLLFG